MSTATATCPSCGADSTGAQRFCGRCGTALAAPPPPPPGIVPAGATPAAPAETAAAGVNRKAALIGLGSAALLLVSAFLPWATVDTAFGSVDIGGFDEGGRGVVMTTFAIIIGVLSAFVLRGRAGKGFKIGLIAAASIALLFAVGYFGEVGDVAEELDGFAEATAGAGPFVATLGGIAALTAGILTKTGDRARPAATA